METKVDTQGDDLLNARVLTEKRLYKLSEKYSALGEEIQSTALTLELINARIEELGIEVD